jgi:hypothetical protein
LGEGAGAAAGAGTAGAVGSPARPAISKAERGPGSDPPPIASWLEKSRIREYSSRSLRAAEPGSALAEEAGSGPAGAGSPPSGSAAAVSAEPRSSEISLSSSAAAAPMVSSSGRAAWTDAAIPASTKRRAWPLLVATSTRPSITTTEAPFSRTVTTNSVPFTSAAIWRVWTPKCGVVFFSILKSARPKSSITWMTPCPSAGAGRRSCVWGETTIYSPPRTSTARPPAAVRIDSPGESVAPRTAG